MKTFLYDKLNTQILEKKLEKKNIPSLLLMMIAGHDLYEIVKKNLITTRLLRLQDQEIMEVTQ